MNFRAHSTHPGLRPPLPWRGPRQWQLKIPSVGGVPERRSGFFPFWECLVFFLFSALFASAAEWTLLENCKLVRSESNDGDSFLVESPVEYRGESKHRVRLYFVDTAETSSNSDFMQDRLKAQAAYWGSNDPDFALKMGMRAKQTVRKLLNQRFDVFTAGEYAPSLGRPRLYAMVKIKDRWLSEILVEQGLVRIYGDGMKLPDGTSAKSYRARLKRLERSAKSLRRNAWRGTTKEEPEPEPESFAPYDARTVRTTWIYSIKDGRKVTVPKSGHTVSVISPAETGKYRVRFKKSGRVFEGLCESRNLKK